MNPTILSGTSRRIRGFRPAALLLCSLAASSLTTPGLAEALATAAKPATAWQDAEKLTVDELAKILRTAGAPRPAMFHTGFRVLFTQAHIPGSAYAGPGSNQAGLDALRKAVAALPKTAPIVLYCGCCPWERCPNLEQPWRMLVAAGFTNVKILYIPTNFGQDWVRKGHPAESGDGTRG